MNSDFAMDESSPQEVPNFTLHPVHGVVWATFFGSPIAAGIVLALNYWRMGQKTAARFAVVIPIIIMAVVFAMIYSLPDDVDIPNSAYYLPQLFIMYGIAKTFQGPQIANHIRNGGKVASAWWSVGIGLLCLPLILGLIFGIVYLFEPSYGTLVEFGNDEVYYAGDATEDDARKLARVLQDLEIFDSGGASVRLESSSGHDTISFIFLENAWEDPETVDAFRIVGRTLIEAGFSTPLTVQLCDEYFVPQETLSIRE